jgi:hypothetical protein
MLPRRRALLPACAAFALPPSVQQRVKQVIE